MKHISTLRGMWWHMLLLIFLAAALNAQETNDAAPIEIALNPLDYVPLAVGNRWTYEHFYLNEFVLHEKGELFDIPGYPPGIPPDSLKFIEKVVTIEITHTEVIDGLEYFVFSDADYVWPSLPGFFWGGKKVRLSDEGFLVFRWNGQDIPVYDFGVTSSPHEYISMLPNGLDTAKIRFNRFYTQHRLSRVSFVFDYYDRGASVFLQGYGMGLTYFYVRSISGAVVFQNVLVPISAIISGEEIVYERNPHFESTGVGLVGQVQMTKGFDFSEGKHSESSNDFELEWRSSFSDFIGLGKSAGFSSPSYPVLSSETGVANLGKIDFDFLARRSMSPQGIPPDLPLDSRAWVDLSEGYTYAVWSREGGIAFLYIFDVELDPESYKWVGYDRRVENIKFDWIYDPDGLPYSDTYVQPTSWGQLKQLILERSISSQDSPNRLGK